MNGINRRLRNVAHARRRWLGSRWALLAAVVGALFLPAALPAQHAGMFPCGCDLPEGPWQMMYGRTWTVGGPGAGAGTLAIRLDREDACRSITLWGLPAYGQITLLRQGQGSSLYVGRRQVEHGSVEFQLRVLAPDAIKGEWVYGAGGARTPLRLSYTGSRERGKGACYWVCRNRDHYRIVREEFGALLEQGRSEEWTSTEYQSRLDAFLEAVYPHRFGGGNGRPAQSDRPAQAGTSPGECGIRTPDLLDTGSEAADEAVWRAAWEHEQVHQRSCEARPDYADWISHAENLVAEEQEAYDVTVRELNSWLWANCEPGEPYSR